MFLMRFTERAYTNYTEEDVRNSPNQAVRLTFSNSNFDPMVGSRQYNEYLDEYEYCEEVGFDGLMLNEHHNTPTCLGATMNLEAAILARNTKTPKIVLLGNPLPVFDNPQRLAEELAEIDMISGGRLVSGFVRGTGVESLAANVNPLFNRERFEEAHDLLIKIWTEPGPFRWEGKHYHFRVVNPFERPIQQPHPPIWIPGLGSPETLVWAAERHYPYIYLETDPQGTQDMMSIYTETARENGYEPGPEHFGYLCRIHVQDTDEKAYEAAKGFLTGNVGVGRVPMPRDYMMPIGYSGRRQRPPRRPLPGPRPQRPVPGPGAGNGQLRRDTGVQPLDCRQPGNRRPQAARRAGPAPPRHPRHLDQRRRHHPRRHHELPAADGRGSAARPARNRRGNGTDRSLPEGPVKSCLNQDYRINRIGVTQLRAISKHSFSLEC